MLGNGWSCLDCVREHPKVGPKLPMGWTKVTVVRDEQTHVFVFCPHASGENVARHIEEFKQTQVKRRRGRRKKGV